MAKFDITAAFQAAVGTAGNVSKLDTSREAIEYISLDKLEADPGNFYRLTGLEDLAANIELCGLQQPVRVRPTEGGRYMIVSGHRRRAALALLAKEDPERWAAVPCLVERDEVSPELRELRLILANSSTRVLSPAEVSKQAQRVETLLYQLKEQGYAFPGRMRDQVAAACKVSAPKLARLKVIREHLIPIYLEHFDRNVLSEQTAYALARMETALQERLANMLPNLPTGSRAEELLELAKAGTNWRPTFSCPDGSPCKRGDAFLRHDLDCGYGELCKGETCCLDCARAKVSCYACERMCSKAKAARKAQRDEEAAKEAERDAKIQENIQKNVQLRAKRLAAAADAAGLENEASILISEYGRGLTVGKLRDWAAGHFDQDDRLYPSTLNARDFSDPVRLAKDLGCSTDYLLGVTDELTGPPAASTSAAKQARETAPDSGDDDGPWHWWPEQPQKSGLYWCITGRPGPGKPRGATYAQVLAHKAAVRKGLEQAARDATVQVQADTHTQRAMWLMVCSIADAYGFGPKQLQKFFTALQDNTDELERMRTDVDEEYAFEKLRQKAQAVTGMEVHYLYEQEALLAEMQAAKEGVSAHE